MGEFETGLAVGMLFGKRGTTPTPTPTPSTKNEILEILDATETITTYTIGNGWEIRIKWDKDLDFRYRQQNDLTDSEGNIVYCRVDNVNMVFWFCYYKNDKIRFALYNDAPRTRGNRNGCVMWNWLYKKINDEYYMYTEGIIHDTVINFTYGTNSYYDVNYKFGYIYYDENGNNIGTVYDETTYSVTSISCNDCMCNREIYSYNLEYCDTYDTWYSDYLEIKEALAS